MMIEFLVDDVDRRNDEFVVAGLVNLEDVRVGSVFRLAFNWQSENGAEGTKMEDPRSVHLVVVKIVAYRRELEELPCGMTGELFLTGTGKEEIGPGIMLKAAI